MKQNKLIGPLLLIIAAFIWGSAFVAQSEGAKHLGPFTFLCLRSFLGTAVLLPVIFVTDMGKKKRIVVFTGAGVSADSGIATFRDADGLWANYRIEEVCTPEALKNNRAKVIDKNSV